MRSSAFSVHTSCPSNTPGTQSSASVRKHKKDLISAHIVAILVAVASVPIPLLMPPLLVDEVLLQQPGRLVFWLNSQFPTAWQGPVLYISAVLYNTNTTNFASFIESATFFINVNHSVPVVSVFASQVLDLLNGNQIDPETGLQFVGVDQQMKAASYGESNEHGNDSWSYDQRGIDFISRDQLGYNYALKDQLFPGKDRKSFQRIILKAAANVNYPFQAGGAHIRDSYVHTLSQLGKLNIDERTNLECVMYANGQYWGVYDLREKVDDTVFTDHYYKQDEPYVQYIQTWGGTWAADAITAGPGLIIMRERAVSINARLSIKSKLNRGTRVSIALPVSVKIEQLPVPVDMKSGRILPESIKSPISGIFLVISPAGKIIFAHC